jgi:hypothetical protein
MQIAEESGSRLLVQVVADVGQIVQTLGVTLSLGKMSTIRTTTRMDVTIMGSLEMVIHWSPGPFTEPLPTLLTMTLHGS